jgi:hypothetical protein
MKNRFQFFPDLINIIIQVSSVQFMPPTAFVPVVGPYWGNEAIEM